MSMSASTSKSSRQNRLRLVLAGIDKHFQNVTSVALGGSTFTLVDLKKLIQTDIDTSDASVQAEASWRTDVQSERDSHAKVNPLLRLFKLCVISQFGDTQSATETLADFGWSPRKSTSKTIATKAGAVAKTAATRTARHTMGSKQKAQVTGETAKGTATGSQPTAVPPTATPTPKPAS
jgi:hypothetical protein